MNKTILIIGLVLLLVVSSGCPTPTPTETVAPEAPVAPTAKALAVPTSVNAGEIISFSGADSMDPDGTITSYEWDFGDGTTASGATVTHAYSNEGTYAVKLTVTDNDGLSDTDTDTVEVNVVTVLLGTIKIDITSSTWRKGEEPYDIYGAIKEKLEKAGFEVVHAAYDATLFVDYKEKTGALYGTYAGRGTNIRCLLKLYDKTNNLLFQKEISARTAAVVSFFEGQDPKERVYQSAVRNFEDDVYFEYLGEIIASKFGVGDEVSILISALEDEDRDTQRSAAKALGEIGDVRAVGPLIAALLKQEKEAWVGVMVRSSAAEALGKIGDARAVEPLIHALKDEDDGVRREAAEALGEIGDVRAVESLIQALKDEHVFVQTSAAFALGKIGDARAIEPLKKALNDESLAVRSAAIEAL